MKVVYFKLTWSDDFTHQYPVIATHKAIEAEEVRLSNFKHLSEYEYSEKKFARVKGLK